MFDPSEKYPVFIIHTKGCFRQKTAEIAKAKTAAEKDYSKRP